CPSKEKIDRRRPRLRSPLRSSKSHLAATARRPWTFPSEHRGRTASTAADTRRFSEAGLVLTAKNRRPHFHVPLSTLPPLKEERESGGGRSRLSVPGPLQKIAE